jgi:hypothetical protein
MLVSLKVNVGGDVMERRGEEKRNRIGWGWNLRTLTF